MELRKLQYFVSVAAWSNFTTAADTNHVSQSTLSRAISDLEYELGIKLFIRNKTSTELTLEGKQLLPIAQKMLEQSNELFDCAKKISVTGAGSLRIGYSGYWEYNYLSKIVHEFKQKAHYSNLSFLREHHGKLNHLLRKGSLDIVLTLKNEEILGESYPNTGWYLIAKCPIYVAVSVHNNLAAKKILNLHDLEDTTQIIVSKNYDYIFNSIISPAFTRAGLTCTFYPVSPLNTYDGLLLVAADVGILIVTKQCSFTKVDGVKYIPLESSMDPIEFGFYYRTDRQANIINTFLTIADNIPKDMFPDIYLS